MDIGGTAPEGDDVEVAEPRLPGVVQRRVAGWAAVVNTFLVDLQPKTRSNYERELTRWAAWCAAQGFDPLNAGHADLTRYKAEITAKFKPSTVNVALVAISGAYKLAVYEDVLDRNPADRVKRPKVNRRAPRRWLNRDELAAVLQVARRAGTLEYALVLLLGINGLRVSEVCNLDFTDISRRQGYPVLFVEGKRDKERMAVLAPITERAINDHLDGRARGPLLLSKRGERLHRGVAWRMVRQLGTDAGIGTPGITPHSLRRAFATIAKQLGVGIQDVATAMGHSDVRTTQLYDQDRDRLAEHPTWVLAELFDPTPEEGSNGG